MGFEVVEATNGEEALGIAINRRPDVIILDFIMPKMHGLDFLRKLRDLDLGRKIPILLLTNFSDDPGIIRAVAEGYCELLKKAETSLGDIVSKVKEKTNDK